MRRVDLGKKLRRLRERSRMTQAQVARILGYESRSSVCELESGKVEVSLDQARTLARIYGTTVAELLGEAVGEARE